MLKPSELTDVVFGRCVHQEHPRCLDKSHDLRHGLKRITDCTAQIEQPNCDRDTLSLMPIISWQAPRLRFGKVKSTRAMSALSTRYRVHTPVMRPPLDSPQHVQHVKTLYVTPRAGICDVVEINGIKVLNMSTARMRSGEVIERPFRSTPTPQRERSMYNSTNQKVPISDKSLLPNSVSVNVSSRSLTPYFTTAATCCPANRSTLHPSPTDRYYDHGWIGQAGTQIDTTITNESTHTRTNFTSTSPVSNGIRRTPVSCMFYKTEKDSRSTKTPKSTSTEDLDGQFSPQDVYTDSAACCDNETVKTRSIYRCQTTHPLSMYSAEDYDIYQRDNLHTQVRPHTRTSGTKAFTLLTDRQKLVKLTVC